MKIRIYIRCLLSDVILLHRIELRLYLVNINNKSTFLSFLFKQFYTA